MKITAKNQGSEETDDLQKLRT